MDGSGLGIHRGVSGERGEILHGSQCTAVKVYGKSGLREAPYHIE
jgi:hypothetical protein